MKRVLSLLLIVAMISGSSISTCAQEVEDARQLENLVQSDDISALNDCPVMCVDSIRQIEVEQISLQSMKSQLSHDPSVHNVRLKDGMLSCQVNGKEVAFHEKVYDNGKTVISITEGNRTDTIEYDKKTKELFVNGGRVIITETRTSRYGNIYDPELENEKGGYGSIAEPNLNNWVLLGQEVRYNCTFEKKIRDITEMVIYAALGYGLGFLGSIALGTISVLKNKTPEEYSVFCGRTLWYDRDLTCRYKERIRFFRKGYISVIPGTTTNQIIMAEI